MRFTNDILFILVLNKLTDIFLYRFDKFKVIHKTSPNKASHTTNNFNIYPTMVLLLFQIPSVFEIFFAQ